MTDNRRRSLLARIREQLAAPEPALAAEPVAEPGLPRRTHLFGSQYRVRMSFEELMATRGYSEQAALYRNRLASASDAHQQSNAELRRGGYTPGEVLWPSD
jgi:hypothetical protein